MVFLYLTVLKGAPMEQTIIHTSWQRLRIGGYSEVEYACDYHYKDGKLVSVGNCYYTGRYR